MKLLNTYYLTNSCSDLVYFSALTLLLGHQEEHLACKNWAMHCRYGARCK